MSAKRRKIWDLYELLSEKEVPICQAWISASVGGPSTKLAQLFKVMNKEKKDANIWDKLYPEETYNDNRLRALFHELGKYVEDYIAFQQFRKAPFLRDLYLIKGLNRRGLAETFRYFYRKVKQRWEKQPIRNSRYYWGLYELEGEFFHHASKFPVKKIQEYISGVEKNLEQAIILDLMRNSLFYKGELDASQRFSEASFLKKLQEVGRNFEYEKTSLLHLYNELYYFLDGRTRNTELLINRIKEVWEFGKTDFCVVGDKSAFLNLGYLVLNKLIIEINREPNLKIQTKLFDYYVWMIEQELLQLDGMLSPGHFRNVITNGLSLKRWTETKNIIEKYIKMVPKANREDAYAFSLGRYLFYTRDYSKSIKVLNRNFNHYLEDLIARFYSLQSQYELEDFDNMLYQIELLKSFIGRHKRLSEAGKSRYLAKTNYFVRLVKAKKADDYKLLKGDIILKKDCASPEWIIEKCGEEIEDNSPE